MSTTVTNMDRLVGTVENLAALVLNHENRLRNLKPLCSSSSRH